MCDRGDKCPECGATSLEACHRQSEDDCARDVLECPTCGAGTTEPCVYVKSK